MAHRRGQMKSGSIPAPSSAKKDSTEGNFEFPDAEQQAKYELELNWCIQKLNVGIINEKNKQKSAEAAKYLNTLKSNSVSVIKKRQLMHNLFGDYRTKMKNEEKTKGPMKVNFTTNDSLDSIVKSKFLRKSRLATAKQVPEPKETTRQPDENAPLKEKQEQNDEPSQNYFKMSPGNPVFKFNFTVDSTE